MFAGLEHSMVGLTTWQLLLLQHARNAAHNHKSH